jgi:hypothetical protein
MDANDASSPPRIKPTCVDSGKLAGMVAVVARHGRVGYSHAIGFMDVGARIPMQTDGVFRIYSMTNPVIGLEILQLADSRSIQQAGNRADTTGSGRIPQGWLMLSLTGQR